MKFGLQIQLDTDHQSSALYLAILLDCSSQETPCFVTLLAIGDLEQESCVPAGARSPADIGRLGRDEASAPKLFWASVRRPPAARSSSLGIGEYAALSAMLDVALVFVSPWSRMEEVAYT